MAVKRKKKKKLIIGLVCFGLVGAIVLTAGIGSGWKYDVKNIGSWFNHGGSVAADKEEAGLLHDGNGGLALPEVSEGNGVRLTSKPVPFSDYEAYGVSPLAESAHTLTAVVSPEDAISKHVDWSVSWANASSSWASGKLVTDYVTVTPESDGALTATAECWEAFGEQIIITVTSRANSEISATKPCEYVQKLTAYTVKLGDFNLVSQTAENFGGNVTASAKMELGTNSDGTPCMGAGGAVNATFEKGTVYTVENEFTVQVTMITEYIDELEGTYAVMGSSKVYMTHGGYIGTDITDVGMRFDRTLFETLGLYLRGESSNKIYLSSMPTKDLITLYENWGLGKGLTTFLIAISGTNFYTSAQVNVKYDGYTNSTPVMDINWSEDTPESLLF